MSPRKRKELTTDEIVETISSGRNLYHFATVIASQIAEKFAMDFPESKAELSGMDHLLVNLIHKHVFAGFMDFTEIDQDPMQEKSREIAKKLRELAHKEIERVRKIDREYEEEEVE